MRIGIDVRCLAQGKRTGVEEYTLALLGQLFETDRENQYVLFFNAWRETLVDFGWATKHANVTVKRYRIPNKLLNLSLWYFGFPRLDRLVGGTDVFFLPNLNFAAVSHRTALVVTAHDLSFELFPETFPWKARLWHFLVGFRRLLRRADAVIAVSQSTRDDLAERYGIPEGRLHIVRSGIGKHFRPMSRNDEALLAVQTRYHLPYRFILSLGTFEPRKNILSLVEAFEALARSGAAAFDKYALVLAGASGWKSAPLYERIRRSEFRDRILLPGFIADADKPALYNLAAAFVYPSFFEGFGFPPLEAMACGVPTIVSHSSSLPEIVGEAGLLVDPYRPDELFRALEQLLADPSLSETLKSRGLERAREFAWAETTRRTLQVFRSAAKARESGEQGRNVV